MPETPIDAAHYPGLAKLGPLAGDIIHRAWVMPPYQSITALVMRELVGKDDLIAAARAQTEEEEVLELTRQAVVAFSTDEVPTRKVMRVVPVRDPSTGEATGEEREEEFEEPDLDKVTWHVVQSQPFPEFDRWKRVTRKLMVAFYNQLNGIDPVEVGKSLASGRDWSPSTRTTTAGRSQSHARQSNSGATAAQRRG